MPISTVIKPTSAFPICVAIVAIVVAGLRDGDSRWNVDLNMEKIFKEQLYFVCYFDCGAEGKKIIVYNVAYSSYFVPQ